MSCVLVSADISSGFTMLPVGTRVPGRMYDEDDYDEACDEDGDELGMALVRMV